jgi:chemotaxis protein methyltransferase CheR
MLSNQQFDQTRRLALNLAGIELVERHRELLDCRRVRLGIPDHAGLDSFLNAAEAGEPAAVQKLLRLLTTKFTGFFRHPRHFDLAAEHALQAARICGRARLWSAAASTGEEPYSLAMALIERFGPGDLPVDILATDVDESALKLAKRGQYVELALRGLDPARRKRFLLPLGAASGWSVAPAVRCLVDWRPLNLVSTPWPVEGPFDVIFCRNVLMYLESSRRQSVLHRMTALLAPDGLLMLDPTEHLGKSDHLFTRAAEGVYMPRQALCRESDMAQETKVAYAMGWSL